MKILTAHTDHSNTPPPPIHWTGWWVNSWQRENPFPPGVEPRFSGQLISISVTVATELPRSDRYLQCSWLKFETHLLFKLRFPSGKENLMRNFAHQFRNLNGRHRDSIVALYNCEITLAHRHRKQQFDTAESWADTNSVIIPSLY
jgi:hypothetical protein